MTPKHKGWVAKAELERYGITILPIEVFLWGGYRYSNPRDALAAAKRGESR